MEDLQTLTAPRVAVVGSRKPTPYALRLAYRCTSVWARAGWWVISGGAYGIDSEAHRATLDTGGRTVCILGSGLNHWYPRTNERLFKSILDKKGCLVSEYPPTMEPKPYHFPERNRLIAAWSQTLFLVQAHEKSGSLSTARTALDLGREVIVLRPPLGVAGFEGSNSLIEAGAKVLTDPTEIEEVYLPKI